MSGKRRNPTQRQKLFRRALGNIIREFRERQSMTQGELATAIGIGQSPQSIRENGYTVWPVEDLVLYADAFGVEMATIVTRANGLANEYHKRGDNG